MELSSATRLRSALVKHEIDEPRVTTTTAAAPKPLPAVTAAGVVLPPEPPPLLIPPELLVLAASPPAASRCWSATAPAAAAARPRAVVRRCWSYRREPESPLPCAIVAAAASSAGRHPHQPSTTSRGLTGVGPPSSLEPRCSSLRVDHHCDGFVVAAARRAAGTLVRELPSTPVSSPLHRQLSSDLLSLLRSLALSLFALSLFSLFPSLSLFSPSYPNLFVSS
ncbi:hypothetical protein Scep_004270 [Stephania cephalantha]|uniref:Uncharacterized protein n=1 Tax=Stephania cephalantha TaxID=152367 RepID=A0AAP0KS99_9MAGN